MHTRAIIIAIALLTAACGTTRTEREKVEVQKSAQIGLAELTDEVNARVQLAANKIIRASENREAKRLMITWQIRTMEYCRRVVRLPDLRVAFVDLWTMLYRTKAYFESTRGEEAIGPSRSIGIEELGALIAMMESRGGEVLSTEQIAELRKAARGWAADNPIRGSADDYPSQPHFDGKETSVFNAIGNLPADIFSIGGGVKDTSQAINNVADAATGVGGVVESLPISMRLQTELLLYRLEEDATVERLLTNVDATSGAVTKIGDTVDSLPDRVRRTLTGTIRDLESTQPEFRKTITEVRGTVGDVKETILDVERTTEKLDPALAHLSAAGNAWEGAFGQLNLVVNPPKDPDEPPSEPAPPLDMKDIRDAAKYLTSAGQELRGTVVEVRAVIEGDGIDQRLKQVDETTDATLAKASVSVGELIDRLTWRAVIVILVFFGAMLGYRVAASRIPRKE